MQVNSLSTEGFRLLETQTLGFAPGINVITGENAQGKTTVLEAVYLLTGVRSFRARYDKELISFDRDAAFVSGDITANGREQKIELRFARGSARRLLCNGSRRSPSELSDALKAVIFSPDDLELVRGGAALRRRMMDAAISQLRPGYISLLSDYQKTLENKNRILKDWREKPDLLDALDEFSYTLCALSAKLIRYRASFVRRFSALAGSVHADFSGGREELTMRYDTVSTVTDPTAAESAVSEEIWARQRTLRTAEIESGQCLVGAHKDELLISINGSEAKTYASQGQTRTAAISMKLAERELFLQDTGESPVLLLDDVLSELDAARQEYVLNRIGGGQTLITSCEAETVSRLAAGRVIRMEGGRAL